MPQSGEFADSQCFITKGNFLTVAKLDETDGLYPGGSSGSSFGSNSPPDYVNEPAIDNYSDESEPIADIDSIRSGESIIKNYIFDNTKYNPNTVKCISFWRAIKERPDLKPCPCDFSIESQSNLANSSMENCSNSETQSLGQCVTWYDALLELQKRKMDQAAFAATFQSCRLCDRDEPYAKFKRKMGQNYSDSELNDDEDLTCLNCWTSQSIKKNQAEAEAARKKDETEEITRIIFMNSCVCKEADSKKCTCSKDHQNSMASEVSDQDSFNLEIAHTTQEFNPVTICSESGEGDSLSVFANAGKIRSCSRGKEYYQNLRRFQNMENPSAEGSNVIMEEDEPEQELENCDCRSCEMSLCGYAAVEKKPVLPGTDDEFSINFSMLADDELSTTAPPLLVDDPSLGSSHPTPTKSPASKMHPQYKPGCCYGCGILGCVCDHCEPVTSKPLGKEKVKAKKLPKKVKIENFDKFLNQCERCGIMNCKCWKNKVDHAKHYLEDLKQILKENTTNDIACGTRDSEDEVSSTKSVNICIICGHKNCDCKYSQGQPSAYFQTIENGPSLPQSTTFAKILDEKLRADESRSSGLDKAKRQLSSISVDMEKLKTISMRNRVEKPIIKDCKNKFMVTPAQKANSIIKNNVNLVLQEDLYGIPHVTRYPDKRPILKPAEDDESYSSQPESSDDDTQVVHDLEPWYCTEKHKEEEPEITYGRIL